MSVRSAGQVSHTLNPVTCPRHLSGCDCPNRDEYICNPYYAGICEEPDHDLSPGDEVEFVGL